MDIDLSSPDPTPDKPTTADLAREACLEAATNRSTPANEAEFMEFIERGTATMTPKTLECLVAELPEIRKKIKGVRSKDFPHAPEQFAFLANVVEAFAKQESAHEEMPFEAVMEATFALQYFHRSTDLIPDSLGPIGYTDDVAVAATVIARHAKPFEKFAHESKCDWRKIYPDAKPALL